MSKKYEFYLDETTLDVLLNAVRDKKDILLVLLEATRYLLVAKKVHIESPKGKVCVVVKKRSRIFIISELKSVSFVMPFTIKEVEGGISFTYQGVDIENRLISSLITVIRDLDVTNAFDVETFFESVYEEGSQLSSLWGVLRGLLFFESGYLRFDHDKKNANGTIHPLKHLDIFYSQRASFKLGLHDDSRHDCILDVLDEDIAKHFIHKT